jgi:deoxyribodipyrimidine photo-lyase
MDINRSTTRTQDIAYICIVQRYMKHSTQVKYLSILFPVAQDVILPAYTMKKLYRRSVHIFRRDLRMHDNTSLYQAVTLSEQVMMCFIGDPAQITHKNKYFSLPALEFMIDSLEELSQACAQNSAKLYIFHGNPLTIIKKIYAHHPFDALFFNKDYTPYAHQRDEALSQWCNNTGIACMTYDDVVLNAPEIVLTQQGKPYSKFTPYFNAARKQNVSDETKIPSSFNGWLHEKMPFSTTLETIFPERSLLLAPYRGGRNRGLRILQTIVDHKNYAAYRDIPAHHTTHLSAHLKFGTLSIRECYHHIVKKLGNNHPLIKQLYWHDFFTAISYYFPFVFGKEFQVKYRTLPWSYHKEHFTRWCTGTTGFPIVDAGMRELNATGYMHNRVRMLVASFLTKDLHIDWRWGEQYFAHKLIDYDPAINNGNWQWCASTGCDAQPYFRIFNPWLQQKRFDPECVYIKTWIPELKQNKPALIHTWDKHYDETIYYKPMVDHATESQRTRTLFMNCKNT